MDEKELLEIIEEAAKKRKTTLDLSGKSIESLPAEIGKLTNLTKIDLSNNQLSGLPAEIGQLTNLTRLDLSRNKLTSLPAEIGKLTNLMQIDLSRNQLSSLPAKIGQLTNLTTLHLDYNQLSSLSAEIGKLKNLTELVLSDNQLSSLPAEIGKLKNLTELDLSDNQLSSLPAEIGQLTSLKVLYLRNNPQLFVGDSQPRILSLIGQLTGLGRLDIRYNDLTEISPEIGQLVNVKEIDLDWNKLKGLQPQIGKLACLKRLSVSQNQLRTLPSEIRHLKNLENLYTPNNQLKSVPAEIGELKKLKGLDLENNPLESPPPEVVRQGTKAILAYLRELAKGKKKRYEAKLLLLGDGGEGKTCVSRALRGLEFKAQIRTEGVEVKPWIFENPEFPGEKEKEITLDIWDFEGQEINHQSHQFFLTRESLYLLVINGRRPFKMERAEYWLDTIRARAPGSRVILVASECENTTPSWPLDRLKENYKDLLQGEKWYFVVGCESRKGIDDLTREIKAAAADMKVMGTEWPESCERAEEEIRERSMRTAYVNRAELHEIFRKSRISEESFEYVGNRMGMLGVVTEFRDSLELADFVVLNPQWLTKAVSLVMEDKQLEKDKGEISHGRMRQIWDKEYAGLYPVFHNCMKEFELCYDMEEKEGCLVPLRFGDARPEIPWSDIPGAKVRRIEYRLSVRPPKGIMSRFIVKTHYMIVKTKEMPKGIYWQNGVFLGTGEGEYRSEALCEFDEGERVLSIRVQAAFPQNMIEQLHGVAKAVFNFFEGLQTERRYGCVRFEEREEQCEGAHAERRILFALSRRKEIDCDVGWHVVNPKELVYGFSSFGEVASEVKELGWRGDVKPPWAEELIKDMRSSLVWIDKTYDEVVAVRESVRKIPADVEQRVKLRMRDHLRMFDEMLDNRDFNSAPAVVSIRPVDGSKFNPRNWFEKEYILRPYCEDTDGVHPVDFSLRFKKPREWWEKTAPKLAVGVKVLSAGLKIGFAGLPLAVDANVFEAMKNEVEFMKELADHLELEGGAESDISAEAGDVVERLKGERLRDLRQVGGEDEKRIVRMQLAKLFEEIAPENYKARQWGPLTRVRMPDNTYRWLCKKHAEVGW